MTLRILLINILFVLCAACSSLKINSETDPYDPGKKLFYTDRIIIKEQRPFDLSELSLRYLLVKTDDTEKKLLGFYFTGKSYPDFRSLELNTGSEIHKLNFKEPVTSEDLGLLGVAVVYYIELPQTIIRQFSLGGDCSLKINSSLENYEYQISRQEKNNFIEFFTTASKLE